VSPYYHFIQRDKAVRNVLGKALYEAKPTRINSLTRGLSASALFFLELILFCPEFILFRLDYFIFP